MSDEGFREVQLTGKKLVFLSMVGAVVLVVVFLLGVMVGRGVRGPVGVETAAPADAAMQASGAPGIVPPPTKPAAGDLDYAALVGGGDPKKAIEPPSAPPEAAATATPAAAADAAKAAGSQPAKPVQPKSAPAQTPDQAAKGDAAKSAAPATPGAGPWVVQLSAHNKKATADGVVASLKKKNFDAFVLHDGPLYHVQVGPFADRAEAERVKALLQKEGFKPLIKR